MSSNCIIIVEYYVLIILCTYFVSFSFYKGRAWAEKASRYRPSVWKVGTKRPGYNASDSDSDEMNDDEKQ